jgi:hypothetical protein
LKGKWGNKLDIVDHGTYVMIKRKAMLTSMEIRSAKMKICIAVMISCECTSENGNTIKSGKCDQ